MSAAKALSVLDVERSESVATLRLLHKEMSARQDKLAGINTTRRCDAVRKAALLLLEGSTEISDNLAREIAPSAGLSPEMTRWVFTEALNGLAACDLEQVVAPQLHPGVGFRVSRPSCCHLILAGNVFTACLQPVAMSLALGIPVLCKTASGQSAFLRLFQWALAQCDPDVAEALNVVTFSRDDLQMLAAFLENADIVVAYGGDATIQKLRGEIAATTRLIDHGHGISVAYVDSKSLTEPKVAEDMALDIAAYDQRGCLSPQVIWLDAAASASEKERFLTMLHEAMERLQSRLPRGPMGAGTAAAQMQWRGVAAIVAKLFEAPDHSIAYVPDGQLSLGPGARNILVHDCAGPEGLTCAIAPYGSHLKQIGLACSAQATHAVLTSLAPNQSPRVCAIGQMQKPPFDGFTEGFSPSAGFVKWVQITL